MASCPLLYGAAPYRRSVTLLAFALGLLAIVYLLYAMLRPERF
jgi:K+-transporting ATPase KdpF subunit